jgi:hypothetical protein
MWSGITEVRGRGWWIAPLSCFLRAPLFASRAANIAVAANNSAISLASESVISLYNTDIAGATAGATTTAGATAIPGATTIAGATAITVDGDPSIAFAHTHIVLSTSLTEIPRSGSTFADQEIAHLLMKGVVSEMPPRHPRHLVRAL